MDAPVIVGDAERRMAARGGVRDPPVTFRGDAREYFGIWIVNILLSIVLLLVMPWIINRSLRFNARVTSWRNVRFNFTGSYWRTLFIFHVSPALVVLTLGLVAPQVSRLKARYLYGGHSYGGVAFETTPRLGALYRGLGAAVVFGAAWLVVFGGLAVLTVPLLMGVGREVPVAFLPIIPALLVVSVAALFYGARERNEAIGRMGLAEHCFRCDLSGMRYAWIGVSGLLATILTLGLLRPWAHVRQWRTVAGAIGVLAVGDLDGFVAERLDAGSSFATEFGAMEGFDVGF